MKVLAVCGSKRKNGNTASLLNKTLEPFKSADIETEIIFPGDLQFSGCSGCEGCSSGRLCIVKDDMQKIYPKIIEADALIAGSPTYFFNMTSDMKKFIDRCYCFFSFDKTDRSVWISRLNQPACKFLGLISVCEQNNIADMGVTPSAMQSAFESLGYRTVFSQKVLFSFKAGEVLKHEDQLQAAYDNGVRLLKTLKMSKSFG